MPKPWSPVRLSDADRKCLERWVRGGKTPQRLARRSRIVLLLAEGLSGRDVARALAISRHTVDLWRARFRDGGCDALTRDRAGRGRKALAGAISRAGIELGRELTTRSNAE